MTTWTPIPTDLGHALWATLRQRLGVDCGVSATATDDRYVLTEVCVRGTTPIPLLRCETWYDLGDYHEATESYRRVVREQRFCVPTPAGAEEEA